MKDKLSLYRPPSINIWQGRADSNADERYFQRIQCLSLNEQALPKNKKNIIIGFASDEGVIRNLGRPGAKEGPEQIKLQLAKLACHHSLHFIDIGSIVCEHNSLEEAQEQFAKLMHYCHQQKHQTIAMGGGHEIAWPHFKGLSQCYPQIGIINIDAHFDLRPLKTDDSASSGTPFLQISRYCQEQNQEFSYCCLGIQEQANTAELFKTANKLNVSWLTADEMIELSLSEQIAFLHRFIEQHQHLYLSICLDAFSESEAPGVSAPQPLGITSKEALPLLKYIMQSGKVVSFDVAELSPPLDQNGKTARLAANLIAKLLEAKECS